MTKFQRTHAAILENALRLFDELGYAQVSVGKIATASGITEMTFYRHFKSKEAILLEDPFDPVIADYIARQPAEMGTLRATTAGFREAWRTVAPSLQDSLKTRLAIIAQTPELKRASIVSTDETANAVAAALKTRGSSEIEAVTVASAVLAALSAALLLWATSDELDITAAIYGALDALEGHDE